MPSTSKKQHNFMAALAHNPSFAKKVGVSQSVGKDFNEADKGRKFGKGGTTQQRINKQDTKHGKLDLPVANLNRMAGMKGGGSVKKFKMDMGGMAGMKKGGMPMKDGKPAFMKKFAEGGKVRTLQDAMADHYPNAEARNVKDDVALEEKFKDAKKQVSEKDYARAAVSGAKGVGHGLRSFASRTAMVPGTVFNEARIGAIKGVRGMLDKKVKDGDAEGGMKKGGMPMKDGKPAFMKKFAKGGGIESRGKTKGTIIKMAAGGSVSARADGIAQRGKTKFTNY